MMSIEATTNEQKNGLEECTLRADSEPEQIGLAHLVYWMDQGCEIIVMAEGEQKIKMVIPKVTERSLTTPV